MSGDTKTGAQVDRALDMLEHLAGRVLDGMSNKDLAAAMRCPPPYVTRTAEQLIRKGWVEKDEATGRFRITTRFSRLTFRVLADFDRAKQALDAAGVKVSSIGSPIGKIKITDDNGPHLERMAHAVKVAQFFEAPYMRIFSYFIDESENPDDYRDEVITRMRDLTSVAEGSGITIEPTVEKDKKPDTDKKTCPQCGAPVSEDALFCNKCGAQL